MSNDLKQKTFELIDDIKKAIHNLGESGGANELEYITHIFLYKFLNDKFIFEVKKIFKQHSKEFESYNLNSEDENFVSDLSSLDEKEYDYIFNFLSGNVPKLKKNHLLENLYKKINNENFVDELDQVFEEIAELNKEIFSTKLKTGKKIPTFNLSIRRKLEDVEEERINPFAVSLINPLIKINFEKMFSEGFDFFSDIYEYLIDDYNKDGGGKYAEYFTPNSVSKIIANVMVPEEVKNVECYDPAAGTGTLLMHLANKIGIENCSIYAQDQQRKSIKLMGFNFILNGLVSSINNTVQENTITDPYFKDKNKLKKFDYIVSNPPFKLDFSEYRDKLTADIYSKRFFAGIPKIKPKKPESMEIFLLFIQHIIYSLKPGGKAAIVVPTGFLSNKSGIELEIKKYLIDNNFLDGVIAMPRNIFATTGTIVSILFINKEKQGNEIRLVNAESFGELEKLKVDNKQVEKIKLSLEDSEKIISLFKTDKLIEKKAVSVSKEEIIKTGYYFSPLVYLPIDSEHEEISKHDLSELISNTLKNLNDYSSKSKKLDLEIEKMLKEIKFDNE
tara:strand:+ start:427 stop:2106 length:1680 start_codon:yes stop_codon:yes gene_type:complete